jgi:phosphate transport system substrate-binding protein
MRFAMACLVCDHGSLGTCPMGANRPSSTLGRRLAPGPLCFAAAAWLAAGSVQAADEVVRVGGTGAALAAMSRLGEAFREVQGSGRLKVLPSLGSTGAVKAVADGALDIAVTGRVLAPREAGLGLVGFEFARTPFAFAVHSRSAATGITPEELARIYRGEMTRWPNGERIRIVLRPSGDADTQDLRAISPEMSLAVSAALARPGMLMAITNTECNDLIERTEGALGPTTLLQSLAEPHGVRLLAWNGVEPSLATMATGSYPLVKSLFLVVRRSPSPEVRRFLEYLASPPAGRILAELGAQAVPFPPVP